MEKPRLSVIMAHLNEGEESLETVRSIMATTTPGFVEVVAVDDCSDPGKSVSLDGVPGVRAFRNDKRRGLFATKNWAVSQALADNLMIIDAHMRFKNDRWAERIVDALAAEPCTAFCTACLGLGWKGGKNEERIPPNIERPNGRYYGATLIIRGKITGRKGRTAVHWLEPKWQGRQDGAVYELPCILGANYGIARAWWEKIGGLRGLRAWGGQEACLSLKTWLAGGKCKIITDIEIGHIFRSAAPYPASHAAIWHNRARMALTILPDPYGRRIYDEIAAKHPVASKMIREDANDVVAERAAFSKVRRDGALEAYVEKFGLKMEW